MNTSEGKTIDELGIITDVAPNDLIPIWDVSGNRTRSMLLSAIGSMVEGTPVGIIQEYVGSVVPNGYLMCNGQEVKIDDYNTLYEIVKDLDEFQSELEGYFKIPNLKKRVLQGADNDLGTFIEAGLPNITGGFNTYIQQGADTGAFSSQAIGGGAQGGEYLAHSIANFNAKNGETKLNGTRSNDVYGKSDTVQPSAFTINYIIKAF